jgi:GGDEF domain-containing protein
VLADLGRAAAQLLPRLGHPRAYAGEETGLLARMGGDEFVILAVDAGAQGEEILTDGCASGYPSHSTSTSRCRRFVIAALSVVHPTRQRGQAGGRRLRHALLPICTYVFVRQFRIVATARAAAPPSAPSPRSA